MIDAARVERDVDTLIDDVVREGRRTDRTLRSFSSPFLQFQPSNDLPTAKEIIGHTAAIYLFVARAYRENVWHEIRFRLETPLPSIQIAAEVLSEARQAAVASAMCCPSTRLRAVVTPFGFPEPAITFLRRALDHEIHHRGELCVYASLFGTPVGDIYECERGRLN